MKKINLNTAWLTVNRLCNFRCKWCYAEDTQYSKDDDMSFSLASSLVDLCSNIGIQEIIIIGGEPTFWPHLFDIVPQIHNQGMDAVLVSNGYLFSNNKFLEKIKKIPLKGISFSLKAGTRQQYIKHTGVDAYQKITKAIRKVADTKIPFGISITLNKLIAKNIEDVVMLGMDNGATNVAIDFCSTVFENNIPQIGYMLEPKEVVKIILEKYAILDSLTCGKLHFGQSLPMCIWPKKFLDNLIEKKQVSFGCQLTTRTGVVFNTDGNIIPCNCLTDINIGKYGNDFIDSNSFYKFWKKPKINQFFNKIIAYPSYECITCETYNICGGGCPLQWFVFDPKKIIG